VITNLRRQKSRSVRFERMTVQFRAESFNLFNHPQFDQPNATIGSGAVGTITSTVGNPRQMQVALRLIF